MVIINQGFDHQYDSKIFKLKSIKDDDVMQEITNKFFDSEHEDYETDVDNLTVLKIEKEFDVDVDSIKTSVWNKRKIKKEAEQEERDRREFERLKRKFEK